MWQFRSVPGFFKQSSGTLDASLFDAKNESFGLEWTGDTRWEEFRARFVKLAQTDTHKHLLLYMARHGQGSHNVAEASYGTAEWDRYWSKLNGDGTLTWGPDPPLTALGRDQAMQQNEAWRRELVKGMPLPQKWYVSPFTRACSTLELTWKDIARDPKPVALNLLRERNGEHTCDRLRDRHSEYLVSTWSVWDFSDIPLDEKDSAWDPNVRETFDQHLVRSRKVLETLAAGEDNIISITAHSGTIETFIAAVSHPPFFVGTGEMVPMVIECIRG